MVRMHLLQSFHQRDDNSSIPHMRTSSFCTYTNYSDQENCHITCRAKRYWKNKIKNCIIFLRIWNIIQLISPNKTNPTFYFSPSGFSNPSTFSFIYVMETGINKWADKWRKQWVTLYLLDLCVTFHLPFLTMVKWMLNLLSRNTFYCRLIIESFLSFVSTNKKVQYDMF